MVRMKNPIPRFHSESLVRGLFFLSGETASGKKETSHLSFIVEQRFRFSLLDFV
jgi:hypothetical protein